MTEDIKNNETWATIRPKLNEVIATCNLMTENYPKEYSLFEDKPSIGGTVINGTMTVKDILNFDKTDITNLENSIAALQNSIAALTTRIDNLEKL